MLPLQKQRFKVTDLEPGPAERILEVVIEMLESGGYEAVQLREVAARTHIGLGTVYKLFPTRHELIVAAIEHWMNANIFLAPMQPVPGETLRDGLIRANRYMYEPWERSPNVLRAFHRARSEPGGDRLRFQGSNNMVAPFVRAIMEGRDPDYVDDVVVIVTNVTLGAIARFVTGELDITDILPSIERAISRLTSNNEPEARGRFRPRMSAKSSGNR